MANQVIDQFQQIALDWLDTDEGQSWLNFTHVPIRFPLVALKEVYGNRNTEYYQAVLWYALDQDGLNPYYDEDYQSLLR